MLKNTVHCALALTVAFAGLALFWIWTRSCGVRADLVNWRGGDPVVFAILLTKGSETPKEGATEELAGGAGDAAGFLRCWGAVLQSARVLPAQRAPRRRRRCDGLDIGMR